MTRKAQLPVSWALAGQDVSAWRQHTRTLRAWRLHWVCSLRGDACAEQTATSHVHMRAGPACHFTWAICWIQRILRPERGVWFVLNSFSLKSHLKHKENVLCCSKPGCSSCSYTHLFGRHALPPATWKQALLPSPQGGRPRTPWQGMAHSCAREEARVSRANIRSVCLA